MAVPTAAPFRFDEKLGLIYDTTQAMRPVAWVVRGGDIPMDEGTANGYMLAMAPGMFEVLQEIAANPHDAQGKAQRLFSQSRMP